MLPTRGAFTLGLCVLPKVQDDKQEQGYVYTYFIFHSLDLHFYCPTTDLSCLNICENTSSLVLLFFLFSSLFTAPLSYQFTKKKANLLPTLKPPGVMASGYNHHWGSKYKDSSNFTAVSLRKNDLTVWLTHSCNPGVFQFPALSKTRDGHNPVASWSLNVLADNRLLCELCHVGGR